MQNPLAAGLVEVRDAGPGKGKGLFAAAPLDDGTWIGDYTGEVLTEDQFHARYPKQDADYVLTANLNYHIDARDPVSSGHMRFANHSSVEPAENTIFTVVRKRKQRHKDIKFFTTRAVAIGEELLYDYGDDYWDGRTKPV